MKNSARDYWVSEVGLTVFVAAMREMSTDGSLSSEKWNKERGAGYPTCTTMCRYLDTNWNGLLRMAGLISYRETQGQAKPSNVNGGDSEPICECYLVDGVEKKPGVERVFTGKGYLWLCQECLDVWESDDHKYLEVADEY